MEVKRVILSLGSNLGDRIAHLQEALNQLAAIGSTSKCSAIYETAPWGFESEHSFFNICIEFWTDISPEELLQKIGSIEQMCGRSRTSGSYSSRTLDIDIILYDNLIIDHENLTVPHPLYDQREFVLAPMAEIVPELTDPRNEKSVLELWTDLGQHAARRHNDLVLNF